MTPNEEPTTEAGRIEVRRVQTSEGLILVVGPFDPTVPEASEAELDALAVRASRALRESEARATSLPTEYDADYRALPDPLLSEARATAPAGLDVEDVRSVLAAWGMNANVVFRREAYERGEEAVKRLRAALAADSEADR